MNELLTTAISAGLEYGRKYADHLLLGTITAEQVTEAEAAADAAWARVTAAQLGTERGVGI